jgi:hypothetical protein
LESDHAEIIARETRGELVIGIDRTFARRLYTDVSLRDIERETGEAPYVEKLIVMGAFVGSPLMLMASSAAAIFVLHWSALLAIPLGLLSWILFKLRSPLGQASLVPISILLGALAICWVLNVDGRGQCFAVLTGYALALWLDRLLYTASTFLLRALISRNARAFTWLKEHFVIRETPGAAA